MAGAVQPALSGDWLNIDSAANSGSGRVPQVNTGGDLPNPAVPTVDHAIAPDAPDIAPASDEILYANSHWADAWPTFTQGDWTKGPAQTPQGNIHGEPDPYENQLAHKTGTVRVDISEYAGYNAQAQVTDTHGWKVNAPSGRSSTRTLIGANGVGYENQWYQTAERPTPKRFAQVAVPNNSPDGTPGVLNGATLPNYADLSTGGPGNIAYSTPAPPQTADPQQGQASGSDWTWGGI
jgi:hypothetical protein